MTVGKRRLIARSVDNRIMFSRTGRRLSLHPVVGVPFGSGCLIRQGYYGGSQAIGIREVKMSQKAIDQQKYGFIDFSGEGDTFKVHRIPDESYESKRDTVITLYHPDFGNMKVTAQNGPPRGGWSFGIGAIDDDQPFLFDQCGWVKFREHGMRLFVPDSVEWKPCIMQTSELTTVNMRENP